MAGGGGEAWAQHLLGLEGLTCVALSVDDFYLTRPEQIRVAEANAGVRGVPATQLADAR